MLKAGSGREESSLTGKPPKRGALLYCARVLGEIGSEALQRRMKSEELGELSQIRLAPDKATAQYGFISG